MAALTAALAVLTLVWSDWIEAVTGFEPDHHDGSFEWELTLVLAVATLILGAVARRTWLRAGREMDTSAAIRRDLPQTVAPPDRRSHRIR